MVNCRSPNDSPSPAAGRRRRAQAAGLLLLALAVRLCYAAGMPLNGDEAAHLLMASQINLRPGLAYAPLGSAGTNHPPGVLLVTALAQWAGGGSVFAVRLAFISLSLLGLLGLYRLGLELFGPRAALIALLLGATDRHLTALSVVFLESPSAIFLAPWAMLWMRRCAQRGLARDWLLLGLIGGLGYWVSTVMLAMLPAFGLYLLLTGKLTQACKSRWMYAGAAVMLAMMLPNAVWNMLHEAVNYERHVGKVGSFGLSPRMGLLYVGDLLICLKDPAWMVQNFSGAMYLPVYVPCQWVMGLVYLALTAVSLRFWRDERIGLLLAVMAGFLIPVTLLNGRELWNEFTWASSTIFAAIALSAIVLERMLRAGPRGAAAASLTLVYAAASLPWFLLGPKWGYFCPEWERAFVGRMLAIQSDRAMDKAQALDEARRLAQEAVAAHPESAMAWYFQGFFAGAIPDREAAYSRSLQLRPGNHPVRMAQVRDLMDAGRWEQAKAMLQQLADDSPADARVYQLLADVEQRLGDYASAAAHARRLLAIKPEDEQAYRMLFLLHDALGDEAAAGRALQGFAARHPLGPAAAYLTLAMDFSERGQPERILGFVRQAIAAGPRMAEHYALIGFLLEELGETEQARWHFQNAARLGSSHPNVYSQEP